MKKPLRVLVVEDSEFDAKMLIRLLNRGGYETIYERVQTADAMGAALAGKEWDLVLSDYNLPGFNATLALQLLQATQLDIPFIIVSGGIGEDVAVAAMKSGASDYLMKGNLARLVPAVERELRDAAVRHARRKAENEVRESEQRYRLLWETATDAILLMDARSLTGRSMAKFCPTNSAGVNPKIVCTAGFANRMGVPFHRISPVSDCVIPAMILASVLFPAPFSPMSDTISPGSIEKLTPWSTRFAPYDFWISAS